MHYFGETFTAHTRWMPTPSDPANITDETTTSQFAEDHTAPAWLEANAAAGPIEVDNPVASELVLVE